MSKNIKSLCQNDKICRVGKSLSKFKMQNAMVVKANSSSADICHNNERFFLKNCRQIIVMNPDAAQVKNQTEKPVGWYIKYIYSWGWFCGVV